MIVLRLALLATAMLVATACAARPDYVIVNRTEAAIAIAPGEILPPCSDVSFDRETLRALGRDLLDALVRGDTSWVPDGAVILESGVPGGSSGSTEPITMIINSQAPPLVRTGLVPSSQWPECAGFPGWG